MKPLRIFLCEDEDISLKMNCLVAMEYLKKKQIKAEFTYRSSYREQDDELLKKMELAILDIDLGGDNGIELAKKMRRLNPSVVIIFITAHQEFSLEAAQIHLSGFLAKPIDPFEFQDTLERAIVQVNGYRVTQGNHHVATFQNGKVVLKERSIISLEKVANTGEVKVITTKEEFLVHGSIKGIEQELSDNFIKLNRSVMVNLSYIFKLENHTVEMNNGMCYSISLRRIQAVNRAYIEFIRKN